MTLPQAGPQTLGGDASDAAKALATELVDYISGADKRNHEQAQATGEVVGVEQAKQALIADVVAKIKAVIPAPKAADKGADKGSHDPTSKSATKI